MLGRGQHRHLTHGQGFCREFRQLRQLIAEGALVVRTARREVGREVQKSHEHADVAACSRREAKCRYVDQQHLVSCFCQGTAGVIGQSDDAVPEGGRLARRLDGASDLSRKGNRQDGRVLREVTNAVAGKIERMVSSCRQSGVTVEGEGSGLAYKGRVSTADEHELTGTGE